MKMDTFHPSALGHSNKSMAPEDWSFTKDQTWIQRDLWWAVHVAKAKSELEWFSKKKLWVNITQKNQKVFQQSINLRVCNHNI